MPARLPPSLLTGFHATLRARSPPSPLPQFSSQTGGQEGMVMVLLGYLRR